MKKLLFILLPVTLFLVSCGGNKNQGWPYEEKKAFIENCISSYNVTSGGLGNAEEYCECFLEKTINEYPTPNDALNMDMKFIVKNAKDCQ